MMAFEVLQEQVRIAGDRGPLAGELAYPLGDADHACLLVNPHPFMGGRMGNRLIAHLARRLAATGAVTLRFDYSGVGESAGPAVDVASGMAEFWQSGKAPQDDRMVEDAISARRWLVEQTALPLAVVGYSFGAFAATRAAAEDVQAVILISPTLKQHDFSQFGDLRLPACVIHSDNDFATPLEVVRPWIDTLSTDVQICCVAGGDHFFKDHLDEVADRCESFLSDTVRTGGVRT